MKLNFARWAAGGVVSLFMVFPAAAATYTLSFFNVDDMMTGYITNSKFANKQILQIQFLQTGSIDFSKFVEPGKNSLLITDYNGPQGWTYGYNFQIDGQTYASDSCGTVNIYGCFANEQGPNNQVVFTKTINFGAPAPESATWVLMLIGFVGLGLVANRARGRAAAV